MDDQEKRVEAALEAAQHFYRIGRFELAEEQLRSALLLAPEEPDLHLWLGRVLRAQERLAEAEAAAAETLRLAPDAYARHDSIALIYLRTGRIQKAREHFREALRLSPADQRLERRWKFCDLMARPYGRIFYLYFLFGQWLPLGPRLFLFLALAV